MSQEVFFSVENGFITDYARDLVLEGNWRKALRTLTEATTPRLRLDEAVSILEGTATLQRLDDGSHLLVPQDPACPRLARYRATSRYQQAGIFELDGEFYRPYGYVTQYGKGDETYALDSLRERDDFVLMDEYLQKRTFFYARHPESDKAFYQINPHPVLFKRVQGPAFWVRTFDTAQAALTDYLSEATLTDLTSGLFENSKDGEVATPDEWEFYYAGAVSGFVLENDSCVLRGDGWTNLRKVFAARERLEEALRALDPQKPSNYDNEGRLHSPEAHDRFYREAAGVFFGARVVERAKAQGGFLTLKIEDGDTSYDLPVARIPFLKWADGITHGEKFGDLPSWRPICPSGLKMYGDNPMHTDWWLGAGLHARSAYVQGDPVTKAAFNFAFSLARSTGTQLVRLAGRGTVTGPVVFPKAGEGVFEGAIAIVPNAGVDYEIALMTACKKGAGAVISAAGGKLAHLATVSRELDARLAVVENAMTVFREGDIVTLNLDDFTFRIRGRSTESATA